MASPKKLDLGPTGERVAANLRRLRERHRGGMSVYEVSKRLEREGVTLQPSGVSRIERGERRVDVDTLIALARVLGVNPSALLMPLDADRRDMVDVTPATR
ncbi:helix-turn-helix domain-containing protein, partial [Actinomadura adrarensis]